MRENPEEMRKRIEKAREDWKKVGQVVQLVNSIEFAGLTEYVHNASVHAGVRDSGGEQVMLSLVEWLQFLQEGFTRKIVGAPRT